MKYLRLRAFLFVTFSIALFCTEIDACGCIPDTECLFKSARQCAISRFAKARAVYLVKIIDSGIKEENRDTINITQSAASATTTGSLAVVPYFELSLDYTYSAVAEVEMGWKDFKWRRILFTAQADNGANCGINLHVGSEYLLFTNLPGNQFAVSVCSINDAQAVQFLPEGQTLKRLVK
jgi:hypothetical protein